MTTKIDDHLRFRIELTASCRDCDGLPKVAGAGQIDASAGVQIMHNGIRVVAGGYYGDWMAEIIKRLNGHHEPQEEVVFHSIQAHVPSQATMLELGGFWSYYSLWFLNEAPGTRRAVVLEPDPANIKVGQQNAVLNNARGIEFLQASVGFKSLEPRPFQSESSGTVIIPQVGVPDLLAAYSIDHLNILHCDAQGVERDVIRSCETLLRERRIDFLVFSTHAHQISGDPLTHQRCLSLVQEFGGRILAEHDVHESFSGDGLIAAYFGERQLDWISPKMSYNRYSNAIFPNPLHDLFDAHARLDVPNRQLTSVAIERNNMDGLSAALAASELRASSALAEVERHQRQLREIYDSSSWRLTRPYRALGRLLKGELPLGRSLMR
jgi:FkbM family methyltransferase